MDETFYSKFIRLYETGDSVEANEYLELGWVLLNVVKTQTAEESWTTYYVLGWNKDIENISRGRSYKQRLSDDFEKKYGRKPDSINPEDYDLDVPF